MNDVKVLANAIRLELLTELRTARSPSVVYGITQRAEVLNMLDRDFGGYQLSAETEETEPKESVRADGLAILADAEVAFRQYQAPRVPKAKAEEGAVRQEDKPASMSESSAEQSQV